MIEILDKYYNLNIESYRECKNGITFIINGDCLYFAKTIYDEEYLNKVLSFSYIMKRKGVLVHDFIFNKDGLLLSDGFVLFKLNVLNEDITIDDIYSFNILFNEYRDFYVDYNSFWENKIDYMEYQVSELSSSKLINNSFDYFVGIAELLLSFLKDNYIYDDVYLVHKKIFNLSSLEFYNPLNITLGCKYKDMVAYYKCTGDKEVLNNMYEKSDNNTKIYLFVRLCFPFKYFDIVNDILFREQDESSLVKVLDNINLYEESLLEFEELFGIYLFDWIKKE